MLGDCGVTATPLSVGSIKDRIEARGLSVLRTQAGEVNAERGAVDHPPFSLDHHPVCGMGAAEDERRQRIASAGKAQLIKLIECRNATAVPLPRAYLRSRSAFRS
jgi:hypothetical protein